MQHSVGARVRACPGETVSGDHAVIRVLDDRVLIAVIDGLGHGPEAAHAANEAAAILQNEEPVLVSLFASAHAALAGTRGAAMTVAIAGPGSVDVAGVGNVALRAHGASAAEVRPAPGIVGSGRFRLRPQTITWSGRVRVVLVSDGVSRRFGWEDLEGLGPDEAATCLVEQHGSARDDATALVLDLFDPSITHPPAPPRGLRG